MDIICIAGLVISIAGFAISLWQLARTRRAAEAALAASVDTARSIRFVNALTDIEAICGRSRDLLHLMRGTDIKTAAIAAFELRDHVAKFYATSAGIALTTTSVWKSLYKQIHSVHEQLELAAINGDLDDRGRSRLLVKIAAMHTQLSSFAGRTVDSGANHAHP